MDATINQVALTQKGRELIDRGFEELAAPTGLTITISGGQVGNLAVSTQGPASVTSSPSTQGVPELSEMIGRLAEAIERSALPVEAKDDAKLEASQVALELSKSKPDVSRIETSMRVISWLTQEAPLVGAVLSSLGFALVGVLEKRRRGAK